MCSNFQPIKKSQSKLFTSNQLSFDFNDEIYPNYNTPLLFATHEDEQMQWRNVRFGMIPKWADNTDITRYTYNARSETVHTKPSFRNAWHKSQFALIPVQAFYEPKYINGKAQRWAIIQEDEQPFTIAAIYEVTRLGDEIIRSMSMLTINADDHSFISQFHRPNVEKRSIVVIPTEQRMNWLKCNHTQAREFLKHLEDRFVARPAPRVTKTQISNQNLLF